MCRDLCEKKYISTPSRMCLTIFSLRMENPLNSKERLELKRFDLFNFDVWNKHSNKWVCQIDVHDVSNASNKMERPNYFNVYSKKKKSETLEL